MRKEEGLENCVGPKEGLMEWGATFSFYTSVMVMVKNVKHTYQFFPFVDFVNCG